jgi:hypothetical protein
MSDALVWHRVQFAFSITFHDLFPQLTMGLALLIVLFKALALHLRDELYNEVARFWGRLFALNFAMGVVTGIPMEFQFGTNWSRFSRFSGEVVARALAMEGVFAFFLESTFLGVLLFGERRLGRASTSRRPSPWPWARGCRATSSSSPTRSCSTRSATGWATTGAAPGEPPRVSLELLGAVAVRPEHGGHGRHGLVRRRRSRGLLVADGPACPVARALGEKPRWASTASTPEPPHVPRPLAAPSVRMESSRS